MPKTAPNNADSLSFEAALSELEGIVRDLESGNAPLEDSIRLYERGIALKNYCTNKLKDAQAKIELITVGQDGALSTKPFQNEE